MNKEFFGAEDCDIKSDAYKIVTPVGYSYAQSAAISLEKANTRIAPLLRAIEVMREALEFYSSGKNWTSITDGLYQFIKIDGSDQLLAGNKDHPTILTAGKRAREALGRVEEILK